MEGRDAPDRGTSEHRPAKHEAKSEDDQDEARGARPEMHRGMNAGRYRHRECAGSEGRGEAAQEQSSEDELLDERRQREAGGEHGELDRTPRDRPRTRWQQEVARDARAESGNGQGQVQSRPTRRSQVAGTIRS